MSGGMEENDARKEEEQDCKNAVGRAISSPYGSQSHRKQQSLRTANKQKNGKN